MKNILCNKITALYYERSANGEFKLIYINLFHVINMKNIDDEKTLNKKMLIKIKL